MSGLRQAGPASPSRTQPATPIAKARNSKESCPFFRVTAARCSVKPNFAASARIHQLFLTSPSFASAHWRAASDCANQLSLSGSLTEPVCQMPLAWHGGSGCIWFARCFAPRPCWPGENSNILENLLCTLACVEQCARCVSAMQINPPQTHMQEVHSLNP
jgi:hypothetical protein